MALKIYNLYENIYTLYPLYKIIFQIVTDKIRCPFLNTYLPLCNTENNGKTFSYLESQRGCHYNGCHYNEKS